MKELLMEDINKVLSELNIENITFDIEVTKNNDHGDYASNVALKLKNVLNQNPRDIAELIVSKINKEHTTKIEIAGPGFINFFVKKDYLYDNINKVLELKEKYGSSNIGNGEKQIIEYVSANPTGFLHIGHARGAAYGDSLSRIKTFTGYDITREYYVNDAGNQMYNLGVSIKLRYLELLGIDINKEDLGYLGKEIIEIASKVKEIYQDTKKDEDIEFFKKFGLNELIERIKIDLKNFRVEFDMWTSEQNLYDTGKVEEVLIKLKDSNYTYEEEGALFLKTTLFGDEKDRVLVKNDGNYTYFLPDIAEHLYKIELGNKKLINVFGADHHGYINRLKAALTIFGYDKDILDIKILQMVRMVKNGEEVKMSKRTGNAYTIHDLLEEVGVDAARYFFALKSLDTQMDFDLDLATKKSNDNPVYYVEYAHARICSILNEYNKEVNIVKYTTLNSEYTHDLMMKIYNFTDIVKLSSQKEMPHIIANYVYELATSFHSFYAHERVLTDDEVYTKERINLLKATAQTIKNALNLLGVAAYEEM